MANKGPASSVSCATQHAPATPTRDGKSDTHVPGNSPSSAYDSSFVAEDIASRMSSEAPRSIRKTRSAARNSSLFASSSSKDIGAPSTVASTPFRGRTEPSVKSSGTPHLDHVLSFHQKFSTPAFAHDIFTSFRFDVDTLGSHDSMNSYFGNWRFHSSSLGHAAGPEVHPASSDDASLGDSDSSEEEHQIILLPRQYSLQSLAKSEPSFSGIQRTRFDKDAKEKHYLAFHKRSKSLPALPAFSPAESHSRSNVFEDPDARRDTCHSFGINGSFEARHFSIRSPDMLEADSTISSLATFELIEAINESERNGKRRILSPKLITKPLEKLQRVVSRFRS